jgi:hypothetical protein
MPEYEPLADLESAGLISDLPAGHDAEGHGAQAARRVLSTLTKEEVDVLTSVRRRLEEEAGLEVDAHTDVSGVIFW